MPKQLARSGDTITFRYYGKEYTRKVLKVILHEPEYLVESCPPHRIKIRHADLVSPNTKVSEPPRKP